MGGRIATGPELSTNLPAAGMRQASQTQPGQILQRLMPHERSSRSQRAHGFVLRSLRETRSQARPPIGRKLVAQS